MDCYRDVKTLRGGADSKKLDDILMVMVHL
jgi:hypothetical protein